jgi:uncharacterized membrane protein
MYLDAREVIRLSMTVEEGAKMILSAGLVVPEFPPPPRPEPKSSKTLTSQSGK